MENKTKNKSLHELPKIIADKRAFQSLIKPNGIESGTIYRHRRKLYKHLDTALGFEAPKSKTTYYRWFSDPQKYLQEAYLLRERKNEVKYKKIIAAMIYALGETLKTIIEETREKQIFYTMKEQEFTNYLNDLSHE